MTDKEIKNEIVEEDKVETPIETDTKTMSENYETIKATCDAMTSDFERFNSKKIKACGQRVRSNLLTIKKLCDTLRKQIINDIKAIPIKHRIDTDDEIPEPLELKREQTVVPETPNDLLVNNSIPVKKVRKPRRANKKKVFE
tara:strand:+ start:141 stop:566 length:426 start_codon:yes stop_codon:yes gene_type:complete